MLLRIRLFCFSATGCSGWEIAFWASLQARSKGNFQSKAKVNWLLLTGDTVIQVFKNAAMLLQWCHCASNFDSLKLESVDVLGKEFFCCQISYPMAKKLNASEFLLEESDRFQGIEVNLTKSTVHVPTNVFDQCKLTTRPLLSGRIEQATRAKGQSPHLLCTSCSSVQSSIESH